MWHLIPVISWMLLRARCAFCGARIPIRYPLIEMAGGMLALLSVGLFGIGWPALAVFAFLCALLVLAVIDIETGYLPDMVTLPLLFCGIVINGLAGLFAGLGSAVMGAAAGYGVFWLLRFAYLKLRGVEGLGLGDAKMLAAIGAWLGWASLPFVALGASLAGLAIVGGLALTGRAIDGQSAVRFGPFLALGALLVVIAWGPLFGPVTVSCFTITSAG